MGLLDVKEAVERAKVTEAKPLEVSAAPKVLSFTGEGRVNTSSRAASARTEAAIEELWSDRQNLVKDWEYLQNAGNPDFGLDELRARVEEKTEAAFEEFGRLNSEVAIASAKENMVLEELGFASRWNGIEQGRLQNFEVVKLALANRLEALNEAKVELEKPSANEIDLEEAIGEVEADISSVERRLRQHKVPTYEDYYWWVATNTSQIKEEIDFITGEISHYQTKYHNSRRPDRPNQKRPIFWDLKTKAEAVESALREYLKWTTQQNNASKKPNSIDKDWKLYDLLNKRDAALDKIEKAYDGLLDFVNKWERRNRENKWSTKNPEDKFSLYNLKKGHWTGDFSSFARNVKKHIDAEEIQLNLKSQLASHEDKLTALKDKKKIADIVKQQKIEALELQIAQTESELEQLEELSVYTEQEVKAADDRLTTIEQQLNTLLDDKASAEEKLPGYEEDYRRFQEAGEEKNSISQQIQELVAEQGSIQKREQNERAQLQNLEAATLVDEPAIVQAKNNINSVQKKLISHRIPAYPSSYRTESTTAVRNEIEQIKADVSFYRERYKTTVLRPDGTPIRNRQIFLDLIPKAQKVQDSLEKYLGILNKQNRIQNGAWGIEEDRELSQVLRERARQQQEILRSYQDLLNWVEKWKRRNSQIWPGGRNTNARNKESAYNSAISNWNRINDSYKANQVAARVSAVQTKQSLESQLASYRQKLASLENNKKNADPVRQQEIESLKLQIAQTESEIEQSQQNIDRLQDQKAVLEEDLLKYQDSDRLLEQTRQQLETIGQQLDTLNGEKDELQKHKVALGEMQKHLDSLAGGKAAAATQAQLENIQEKLDKMRSQSTSAERKLQQFLETSGYFLPTRERLAIIDKRIKELLTEQLTVQTTKFELSMQPGAEQIPEMEAISNQLQNYIDDLELELLRMQVQRDALALTVPDSLERMAIADVKAEIEKHKASVGETDLPLERYLDFLDGIEGSGGNLRDGFDDLSASLQRAKTELEEAEDFVVSLGIQQLQLEDEEIATKAAIVKTEEEIPKTEEAISQTQNKIGEIQASLAALPTLAEIQTSKTQKQAEIDERESAIASTRSQINNISRQQSSYRSLIRSRNSSISNYSRQVSNLYSHANFYERQRQTYQAEVERLTSKGLWHRVATWQNGRIVYKWVYRKNRAQKLDDAKAKVQDFTRARDSARQQAQSLNATISRMRTEISAWNRQISSLNNQQRGFNNQLTADRSQLSNLQQELEKLVGQENDVNSYTEQLGTQNTQLSQLQQKLDELTNSLPLLKEKLPTIAQQLTDKYREKELVETYLPQVQAEVERFQGRLDLFQRADVLEQEYQTQQDEWQKATEEQSTATDELLATRLEGASDRARFAALEAFVAEAQAKIDAYEAEKAETKTSLEKLQDERELMQMELSNLNLQLKSNENLQESRNEVYEQAHEQAEFHKERKWQNGRYRPRQARLYNEFREDASLLSDRLNGLLAARNQIEGRINDLEKDMDKNQSEINSLVSKESALERQISEQEGSVAEWQTELASLKTILDPLETKEQAQRTVFDNANTKLQDTSGNIAETMEEQVSALRRLIGLGMVGSESDIDFFSTQVETKVNELIEQIGGRDGQLKEQAERLQQLITDREQEFEQKAEKAKAIRAQADLLEQQAATAYQRSQKQGRVYSKTWRKYTYKQFGRRTSEWKTNFYTDPDYINYEVFTQQAAELRREADNLEALVNSSEDKKLIEDVVELLKEQNAHLDTWQGENKATVEKLEKWLADAIAALSPLREKQELETREKLIRNDIRLKALESQKRSEQAVAEALETDSILSYVKLSDRATEDLQNLAQNWVKDWQSGNQMTKKLGEKQQQQSQSVDELIEYIQQNLADPHGEYLRGGANLRDALTVLGVVAPRADQYAIGSVQEVDVETNLPLESIIDTEETTQADESDAESDWISSINNLVNGVANAPENVGPEETTQADESVADTEESVTQEPQFGRVQSVTNTEQAVEGLDLRVDHYTELGEKLGPIAERYKKDAQVEEYIKLWQRLKKAESLMLQADALEREWQPSWDRLIDLNEQALEKEKEAEKLSKRASKAGKNSNRRAILESDSQRLKNQASALRQQAARLLTKNTSMPQDIYDLRSKGYSELTSVISNASTEASKIGYHSDASNLNSTWNGLNSTSERLNREANVLEKEAARIQEKINNTFSKPGMRSKDFSKIVQALEKSLSTIGNDDNANATNSGSDSLQDRDAANAITQVEGAIENLLRKKGESLQQLPEVMLAESDYKQQLQQAKAALAQAEGKAKAVLDTISWYETQIEDHGKQSKGKGYIYSDEEDFVHVDHHSLIVKNYEKMLNGRKGATPGSEENLGLRQVAINNLAEAERWRAEVARLSEVVAQEEEAKEAAAGARYASKEFRNFAEQLQVREKYIPSYEQQGDRLEDLVETLKPQRAEAIASAQKVTNKVESRWQEYEGAAANYQKAIAEVLERRGTVNQQALELQHLMAEAERELERQSVAMATELEQGLSLKDAIYTAYQETVGKIQQLESEGRTDGLTELETKKVQLEKTLHLLTNKAAVLTSQQTALTQKRTLLAAQNEVIWAEQRLIDAYIQDPDDDFSNVEKLLEDAREALAEAQELAEQAANASAALSEHLQGLQSDLEAQNQDHLDQLQNHRDTFKELINKVEIQNNLAKEAAQKQQEINNLESELIDALEEAIEAGDREAERLLDAVRNRDFAVAAGIYATDYRDLAENEEEGKKYLPLFHKYRRKRLDHREKQKEALQETVDAQELKLAAEATMATLDDEIETAQKQLDDIEGRLNEAQEDQERLQQELAIAQVRVDETERLRAQTEQTIVQLVALEEMNLAQAQLEQEIAKARQQDIDKAVRDRLLRDQRELERERQATIAEIELIKQLQAEDGLRLALNQMRGILGQSDLAATDDADELESQLAGLQSHLGSTEAQLAGLLEGFDKLEAEQLADFPEELKTLLADAKTDINDALQGKEAANISASLVPVMLGLQEQLKSYQKEIDEITKDDEKDQELLEELTESLGDNLDDYQHKVAQSHLLEEEKEILQPDYIASQHKIQYAEQVEKLSKDLAQQSRTVLEEIIQKRIEKREAAKKSFFEKVLGIVSQIVGILSTIAGILAFAFPPLAPLAAGLIAVNGVVSAVQAAANGDWMGAIFTVVTSAVSALTAGMGNVLSEGAKLAIQGWQSVASGAFSGVRSIMSGDSILGGLQILSGFAGAVANGVQGFFGQLNTVGQNALYQVFNTLQSVPTMIYGSIQGIQNGDWFGAVSNIFNVITTIASNFGGIINDTAGKFFEYLGKVGNTGLAIGGAAMDGTVEGLLAATNGVLGIWQEDLGRLVGNIVGKDECECSETSVDEEDDSISEKDREELLNDPEAQEVWNEIEKSQGLPPGSIRNQLMSMSLEDFSALVVDAKTITVDDVLASVHYGDTPNAKEEILLTGTATANYILVDGVEYPHVIIQEGETLWELAERRLGDGSRWREIVKADGSIFTEEEARNLQVGENVYLPSTVEPQPQTTDNHILVDGVEYPQITLQEGDTLWGLAERKLGDGNRWSEFGKPDGSRFTEEEARNLQPGETIYRIWSRSNPGYGKDDGQDEFTSGDLEKSQPLSLKEQKIYEVKFSESLKAALFYKPVANDLVNHFLEGTGETFQHNPGSDLSNMVKNSQEFKDFVTSVNRNIDNGIKNQKTTNGTVNPSNLEIQVPSISFPPLNINLFAAIGGTQGTDLIIKDFAYKEVNGKKTYSGTLRVIIYDDFAAGNDDRKRLSSLEAMWNLQRRGTAKPFVNKVIVDIPIHNQ